MVGTFNSGCVALIIPVANRAPDGPLAIVSPANTYLGLTKSGPGTMAGEPDKYYPNGTRNFARVVAADDYQGAADALLAQQLGLTNVFILTDKELYGQGIADLTEAALGELGIGVAGVQAWDGRQTSYEALANRVAGTGADGVFLAGVIDNNGGKLIKDMRAVLGADFPIIVPDGFTPIPAVVDEAGAASEGVYVTVAGVPTEQLAGRGKEFIDGFAAARPATGPARTRPTPRRRPTCCSTRSPRPAAPCRGGRERLLARRRGRDPRRLQHQRDR